MVKNFARRLGAVTTGALVLLFIFHISSCQRNGTSFTVSAHPAMAAGSIIVIVPDSSTIVGSGTHPSPKYIYVGTLQDNIEPDAKILVNISFNPAIKQ